MGSEQQATARERIENLLNEYGMWVAGDIYRKRNFEDDAEAVDEVIAIVREALLSEASLEAAADIWNHHHAPTCDRAIGASLDAAFPDTAE